ncbi:MAG: glycosyltransferase [Acidimicrobiia bacterium]|jgi:glycosyltransferase involved in cell wall biosynthesis
MSRPAGGSPLATVVITTHDRIDYAHRAVASALAQTVADIEVVVVDDGSVPPFVPATDDPRVRLVRRDRSGGMCAARNDGLAVARGPWITFLDDDDEIAPELLERAIAAAAASPLPVPVATMAALAVVAPDGVEVERVLPLTLRRGEHCFLEGRGEFRAKNALVIPTDVVRAIGGWDADLPDWDADDFGIRLNLVASVQGIDDPLYRLTAHDGPRASRKWAGIAANMEQTLAKHPEVFRRHRAVHAAYLSRLGFYHLKAGHWRAAVVWTWRGLLRDPRRPRQWVFLGAALAGPDALRASRRVRSTDPDTSTWTLTTRRVRKYARRLADVPRALVGAPLGAVTRTLARRGGRLDAGVTRSVLVLCIYRARNAALVAALVDEAASRGWDARLWALDASEPTLAEWTVGAGSGAKFPLLNGLLHEIDLDGYDWVVVADDDFAFDHGSLADVLAVAEAAGLDLVQPAHTERSYRDNEIGVRRPLSVARRTTFVEIGPVFAVRRPWSGQVLPFPADHTMGWGLELEWFDLERRGARLGIVDAVPLRHLHPVGRGYAKQDELDRLRARLRERGFESLADVQRTVGTWRPWQPRPPWSGRQ